MFLEGSFIYSREPMKAAKVWFYRNKTDREVLLFVVDESASLRSRPCF